jgi:hypothetical protein
VGGVKRTQDRKERRTSSDNAPPGAVVGARGWRLGLAFMERVNFLES